MFSVCPGIAEQDQVGEERADGEAEIVPQNERLHLLGEEAHQQPGRQPLIVEPMTMLTISERTSG